MKLFKVGTCVRTVAGALTFVLFFGGVVGAADIPRDQPGIYPLAQCESDSELNCIESIEIQNDDGSFTAGEVTDPGRKDWQGSQNWKIPGLQPEVGVSDVITASVFLIGQGTRHKNGITAPEFQVSSRLQIYLQPAEPINIPLEIESCIEDCYRFSQFSNEHSLRIKIRLSWLEIGLAQASLQDSVLGIEKIEGGSRLTLEGKALGAPGYVAVKGSGSSILTRKRADYISQRWVAMFLDKNDPSFPLACSRFGFPYVSGNYSSGGTPMWRGTDFSLEIWAPHSRDDGTDFFGYYEAIIPGKYASCLWKKDAARMSAYLKIEVLDQNGREKVATTSLGMRDGDLIVRAYNFTFSSPKIRLVPKSRVSKSGLISCKSGTEVKRIDPKKSSCPSGWTRGR